jgi:hypothetical protein
MLSASDTQITTIRFGNRVGESSRIVAIVAGFFRHHCLKQVDPFCSFG